MVGPFFVVNLDGLITPPKPFTFINHVLISVGVDLPNNHRIGRFFTLVGCISGNMQDL